MTSSEHAGRSPEDGGRLAADGVLAAITALWGFTFVAVKGALSHAEPFTFLTLRFLAGALVLTVVARRSLLVPQNLRRGLLLGLFLFLGFAFQTTGLLYTTPSRSAFITGLYVLVTPALGYVLFQRVPRGTSLLGVALSAVGLYQLTGAGLEGGLGRGDWLTLACAVAYGVHIVLTERYAPREGATSLVAVQLWTVALLSALCLPWSGAHVEWTSGLVGTVLFTGVCVSAGAITLQTWAQARTTAVRAALIYVLEPVFAALYSVVLGYESPSAREWLGGGLILLGVLTAELGAWLWDRLAARGRAGGAMPGSLP